MHFFFWMHSKLIMTTPEREAIFGDMKPKIKLPASGYFHRLFSGHDSWGARLKFAYEILFSLALLANILLAIFDALYLFNIPYVDRTFRDVQLILAERFDFMKHREPGVVLFYDPLKGIEPHRTTVGYLKKFDRLKERLQNEDGNLNPETQRLLAELIVDMEAIVDKRPPLSDFSLAEKDGTLENLKNKMRLHFLIPGEKLRGKSAKKSFRRFFSAANLSPERRGGEIAFFDNEIRPLLEQNYFRWIGDDGQPKDYYSRRIDIWFVLLLFWPDFLIRWGYAVHRRKYRRWYLFPLRNWSYVFTLILPHHAAWLRLLRLIPLYQRLNANNWLPGGGVMPNIIHENASIIAEEISGLVLINIIAQMQTMIKSGDATELGDLSRSGIVNQLGNLADSQVGAVSRNLIPAIHGDIGDLTEFAINRALDPYLNTPLGVPLRLILQPVHGGVRDGLKAALATPEGLDRLNALLHKVIRTALKELTRTDNIEILQKQLDILLESIKTEIAEAVQNRN